MIAMVYKEFRFNPIKDKTPISRTGYIDLKSAMVNNAIPSNIAESEDDYNGIEDPVSILGKPRDVFEAIDMQAHINNFIPPAKNDEE